uniref:Amiloride-sensitive sodium channel subunit beta n=1 Tax=Latimeria chalumnae TaxID=7897 RepID=H3AVV2_LATCH
MSVRKYFTRALHRLQKGPGYTYKELLVWYCDNTNTHGPKRIIKEGPKKQVLWFILTLTFTALIFWQWGLLIQTYLSYGVSTSLSMGFRAMEFPAVTVCNVNPMKYSEPPKLIQSMHFLIFLFLTKKISKRERHSLTPVWKTNLKKLLILPKTSQACVYLQKPQFLYLVSFFNKYHILKIVVLPLANEKKQKVSVLCKDERMGKKKKSSVYFTNAFLSRVTHNYVQNFFFTDSSLVYAPTEGRLSFLQVHYGEMCAYFSWTLLTVINFTQMFHPTYGNCYIFNWGQDGNALISSNPGADFGLKLVLDINQEEYIPFLTTSAGARLMLHDQNTFPFLKDLGMYAMAGSQTSIGILVDEIQRIGAPYSQCTPYGSDVPVPNLYSIYNTSYSMQNCLYSCLQAKLVEKCGCGNYLHPLPDGAHSCNNEDNPSWAYCYYSLGDSSEYKDSCLQICEQPCNETQYRLTISMADWPSESSEDWIFHVLSYERDLAINRTMNRNGALKLNLYFQEFNYRTISESAATDISWLVSNLEGQFGFWMGGSILCIIEFLEIIIDCVWITIIKLVIWYRDRKHKKAQAQYSGPPPSVSQLARAHTDTGFQHDSTDINYGTEAYCNEAYIPPREPTPGTPPPNYDSLRVQPVENTEQISDSEEN